MHPYWHSWIKAISSFGIPFFCQFVLGQSSYTLKGPVSLLVWTESQKISWVDSGLLFLPPIPGKHCSTQALTLLIFGIRKEYHSKAFGLTHTLLPSVGNLEHIVLTVGSTHSMPLTDSARSERDCYHILLFFTWPAGQSLFILCFRYRKVQHIRSLYIRQLPEKWTSVLEG